MFLEAIRDALIFTAFIVGMVVLPALVIDLICGTAHRLKGGGHRGHSH